MEEVQESNQSTTVETLYNADENCEHDIQTQWSGVKCIKCSGWFCY